ncbi:MAG: ATP-binding protein [Desulfobacteraceae bacterium]|nr:ATP-binding protein [Desulfobacteraceae bacterium]MBC2720064.1 ATP-binding protein [Desulfobacteraceae bacterium]
MRFFNTAGPANCEKHYCLSPLDRFDLDEIISLINQEKYFVLHAPRQTGKTTCLLALMDYLNKEGKYKCLYINVESAQGAREDVYRGIRAILNEMGLSERIYLDDPFVNKIWRDVLDKSGEDTALNEILTLWSEDSAKPVVLLIDEIDSLIGDTLISVLRQIRAGYHRRPKLFPQSIILCGVRDIRDYRIHSSREKTIITGGSAFNIKAESLRLGDFTKDEVNILYNQHTKETGQVFESESIDFAWKLTSGQPWLVNALGYEACFKIKEGRDRLKLITKLMIEQAKDNIILRRDTHIDQLMDKLREERVKRVVNPMLQGLDMEHASEDDIQYVLDLGLVCKSPQGLQIANRIYKEVIPRHLTVTTQYNLESRINPLWYIGLDGSIDMEKLLSAFQEFFREHSEHWIERFQYKEAVPQLLLQAFLQRIVNSGGRVEREYGLGRMRTDLLVIWRIQGSGGEQIQRVVIELKILYKSLETTIKEGLSQTAKYMDRCGTSDGHLIIFDRRENITWDEKIFQYTERYKDREIMVWGM